MHPFLHVKELDLGTLVRTRSVSTDQLAQPGAIDIAYVAEIQQEVFLALLEPSPNVMRPLISTIVLVGDEGFRTRIVGQLR